MTFAAAIARDQNATQTTNGMAALRTTLNACVDLFFKIGASRKMEPTAIGDIFMAAYREDSETALRIAAWARDARGGAGERRAFRIILTTLEERFENAAVMRLLNKTPEIGRWDDILSVKSPKLIQHVFEMIAQAIKDGDRLVVKWMPREQNNSPERTKTARRLARFLADLGPDASDRDKRAAYKNYRQLLARLTTVIETQMCAKEWDKIVFDHVPSVAHARYRKAFSKHQPERYVAYLESVKKGEAKIAAGAVFPHDVIKTVLNHHTPEPSVRASIIAQWEALPNHCGDASVLPMIDTSGSMAQPTSGSTDAMGIAIAMGLYFADKNRGAFRDVYVTFSGSPSIKQMKGDIVEKVQYLYGNSDWGQNTNLEAAFAAILDMAKRGNVAPEDMPKTLLILSDMQFDAATRGRDKTAFAMIRDQYALADYTMPNVVFWNIVGNGNVPVEYDQEGTALVSGFSPAIAQSILAADTMTPYDMMLAAISKERYNI